MMVVNHNLLILIFAHLLIPCLVQSFQSCNNARRSPLFTTQLPTLQKGVRRYERSIEEANGHSPNDELPQEKDENLVAATTDVVVEKNNSSGVAGSETEEAAHTAVVSSQLNESSNNNVSLSSHDNDAPDTTTTEEDSLLKFSQDVKRVLHDLRGLDVDPGVPKHLMGAATTLSYSKTWTLEDWEYYNSRKRYFRYLLKFPRSRLLRRTAPQQLTLFCWALVSNWIVQHFFKQQQLPLSALGSISTFVAFLLTLRSNQGLARLDEARRQWSKVIVYTREMSQLISAFIYPIDKQLALMLTRHVSIFGWLLKSQLRFTKNEDVIDVVRTMLPNKQDAEYLLSQRQKTVAVITRIRQVIALLGKQHRLTTAEENNLEHAAQVLSELITSTGRIRAAPIPTLYTSHTTRLLVIYLFCLPPALRWSGLDGIMTTLVTMVVGYTMLGLDEISHLFEQPFRVIPMYNMSKRSMTAVADAMTCRPPALKGEKRDKEEDTRTQKELTTYWSNKDIATVSDNMME